MNDLISRQAALDALEWKWAGRAAIKAIKQLPSADRPQGEWLDAEAAKLYGESYYFRMCSSCGYGRDDDDSSKDTAYCPNCGARMKGVSDGI